MSGMVSVIIPVYNVEKYLKRCTDSILGQSYTDLEVILIDDGSTDSSGEICDQIMQADPRVKVIHKKNGGVSSARNCGLDLCTGAYVSFADADDWMHPDMLRDMIAAIEAHEADFAVCKEQHVTEGPSGELVFSEAKRWDSISGQLAVDRDGVYQKVFAQTATLWNKVFRRDLIGEKRLDTSLRYGEDCAFVLDVLNNANRAVIVPEVYYNYFSDRKGNVVSAPLDERSLELLRVAEDLYRDLAERGYPDAGVHRVMTSIHEVAKKLLHDRTTDPLHEMCLATCKRLARVPSSREVMAYWKSDLDPLKNKVSYLIARSSFAFWIWSKRLVQS